MEKPTSEDGARWAETDRLLSERVAVLDRRIADEKKKRSSGRQP